MRIQYRKKEIYSQKACGFSTEEKEFSFMCPGVSSTSCSPYSSCSTFRSLSVVQRKHIVVSAPRLFPGTPLSFSQLPMSSTKAEAIRKDCWPRRTKPAFFLYRLCPNPFIKLEKGGRDYSGAIPTSLIATLSYSPLRTTNTYYSQYGRTAVPSVPSNVSLLVKAETAYLTSLLLVTIKH